MSDVLYAVIPAYNESDNIEALVEEWVGPITATGSQARLVIVNDGSKDNTAELLEQLAAKHGEALVVLNKPNSGHGATLLYGYRYALEHGADFVFQTDSDRQTLPSEFPAFWDARHEADAVIGWRSGRQDGFSRVVVTRVLRLVVRLTLGVKAKDANCPFWLMRAGALAEILPTIPPAHNLANVLITARFLQLGMKVKWIEVTFRPRQGGVNSINIPKIIGIGRRAVADFAGLRRLAKPKPAGD
ncbi:MAG: glycosyltransferase family 2 protein [Bifidobacteriaceae bacterium]|jgi:glycosyltransferase involved in cell wall biosynthesis|nr:glycosyltransferase family 2 protein [Bifidobacteriaceae bacterium]